MVVVLIYLTANERKREREREIEFFPDAGREFFVRRTKKRCGENFKKSPLKNKRRRRRRRRRKRKRRRRRNREALLHYFGDQNIG